MPDSCDENRELLLASVSLPRFKTSCFANEENQRIVRNMLIEECKRLSDKPVGNVDDENPIDTEQEDFFLSFNSSIRRTSIDDRIESEVQRYLNDIRKNENILDEYPSVRNVFFRFNTTLSASAAVERLFSQSMMLFAPRRNRISSENFERALLLKQNRQNL